MPTKWEQKRKRLRIVEAKLPSSAVDLFRKQCGGIVENAMTDIPHVRNLAELIESVAMSCYYQGALDGARTAKMRPQLLEIFDEPASVQIDIDETG